MSFVLKRWNQLPAGQAATEILPCCGSDAWAAGMAKQRPLENEAALLAASDEVWRGLREADWLQSFRSHPRIGQSGIGQSGIGQSGIGESGIGAGAQASTAKSAAWASQEQHKVADADDAVKMALAEGNREYERRFQHIFIVCATGKTAPEMLTILRQRLHNDAAAELREAAEQQQLITQIRLKKWLDS